LLFRDTLVMPVQNKFLEASRASLSNNALEEVKVALGGLCHE
jgi:hypothetical protein